MKNLLGIHGFLEFYSQQPLHFYTESEEPTGNGLHLEKYRGNYEYEQIDYYKDPSEHFLVVTKCRDNKVICEFFGHAE